jgi:hypothetical protein
MKLNLVISFLYYFSRKCVPELSPFSYAPLLWESVHTPLLQDQTQLQMHHICQLFLLPHCLLRYKLHHLLQPRHIHMCTHKHTVSIYRGKERAGDKKRRN